MLLEAKGDVELAMRDGEHGHIFVSFSGDVMFSLLTFLSAPLLGVLFFFILFVGCLTGIERCLKRMFFEIFLEYLYRALKLLHHFRVLSRNVSCFFDVRPQIIKCVVLTAHSFEAIIANANDPRKVAGIIKISIG